MQHSYEATIAKKENDLSSLLQSINQAESQAEDFKEFKAKIGDLNYFNAITYSLSRGETLFSLFPRHLHDLTFYGCTTVPGIAL